ncbi:MAG: DnaD domain protein [Bacilli bacterium]|nr:DnaD domain protein [Bacilli bacterium]
MVILSNSDMLEVRINSLLADYDRETLTNLYQPIIGFSALAVYFTLWSEASIQKVLSFSSHDQLLIRMKMPKGQFIDARKLLEAVGLVKTRLEKAPGTCIYHYELNSPKTPKGFFADTLLYGMLIQALGESDANRIKKVYEVNDYRDEGEDISSSFNDVFHPDFEDPSFIAAASSENHTVGRNKIKIDTEFSFEKFFNALGEISQINEKAISKKELKEIERLSSLYGIDEETAASVVASNYDSLKEKGNRLNFEEINKAFMQEVNYTFITKKNRKSRDGKVNSDTQLANKINLFETMNPIEVLRLLQGGTKVAPSDIKIIETLSKDYRLPNGVINVIIDFVLQMNKNVLSRAYAEKMAASFNREGIETTIDAMNYCNEVLQNQSKSKKTRRKKKSDDDEPIENINNNDNNEVSESDWDKLFENEEEGEENNGTIDTELPF